MVILVLVLCTVFSVLVAVGISVVEEELSGKKTGFWPFVGSVIFWPSFFGMWLAHSVTAFEKERRTKKGSSK